MSNWTDKYDGKQMRNRRTGVVQRAESLLSNYGGPFVQLDLGYLDEVSLLRDYEPIAESTPAHVSLKEYDGKPARHRLVGEVCTAYFDEDRLVMIWPDGSTSKYYDNFNGRQMFTFHYEVIEAKPQSEYGATCSRCNEHYEHAQVVPGFTCYSCRVTL